MGFSMNDTRCIDVGAALLTDSVPVVCFARPDRFRVICMPNLFAGPAQISAKFFADLLFERLCVSLFSAASCR